MYVCTSVHPSATKAQKQNDLPLDFLPFLCRSYRSVFARLLLFRIDARRVSFVFIECPFRTARAPVKRRATFFYFALASSRLRESIRRGRASQRDLFLFRVVHTRECVAGINQSTSPGIRVYGTPRAWMTSRGSRDGARCARMTRFDF